MSFSIGMEGFPAACCGVLQCLSLLFLLPFAGCVKIPADLGVLPTRVQSLSDTISITAPGANAKFLTGDTITVQWAQSVANPTLLYTYNALSGGWQQFGTIISVNSQEAIVALPTTSYSDSFQIKVEDDAGVYHAGVSEYLHVKYIILTSALAGQTFSAGDAVSLTWRINRSFFTALSILLSTDSGKSFNNIASSAIQPTVTFYTWMVGAETGGTFTYPSSGCIVQIRDYAQPNYKDQSGLFSVQQNNASAATLHQLYDSTVYASWIPDSESGYAAYDSTTVSNAIDGAAPTYVQAGMITFASKHLENTSPSETLSCRIYLMNFGTTAKAAAIFNTTTSDHGASTALPPLGVSEAAYAVQTGANINAYAHFDQFYFEIALTGHHTVADAVNDALYFLTKYKAVIDGPA